MKKFVLALTLTLCSLIVFAQEAEGTKEVYTWSDQTKIYWLISIFALSIFLAGRTFRDKPDA